MSDGSLMAVCDAIRDRKRGQMSEILRERFQDRFKYLPSSLALDFVKPSIIWYHNLDMMIELPSFMKFKAFVKRGSAFIMYEF